ncbi:HAD-like domain-containing protein [Chytriomyces sp. MP71]|nr:HAD-like domain-containing protein [Chytriomyces sp. MP71]
MALRRPILIVLDLNGTLLDRLTKGPERSAANKNPLRPKEPDYSLNRCKIYLRPYLDVFLKFLLENFHVAAWTSATPKNAHPMVDFIFEPFGGRACLEFAWDRDSCIPEPIPGSPYNTVKDLSRIWRLDADAPISGGWTRHNTILLDDTAGKSCRTPLNHLLLPTFSVGDTIGTPNCDTDASLLCTISYLNALLRARDATAEVGAEVGEAAFSVQKYLPENPFFVGTPETGVKLANEAHAANPAPELVAMRHRRGTVELLGEVAGKLYLDDEEQHGRSDGGYAGGGAKFGKKIDKFRQKESEWNAVGEGGQHLRFGSDGVNEAVEKGGTPSNDKQLAEDQDSKKEKRRQERNARLREKLEVENSKMAEGTTKESSEAKKLSRKEKKAAKRKARSAEDLRAVAVGGESVGRGIDKIHDNREGGLPARKKRDESLGNGIDSDTNGVGANGSMIRVSIHSACEDVC